jgi:peroxiredoxin/V8-like Glu-specific endopeptidase
MLIFVDLKHMTRNTIRSLLPAAALLLIMALALNACAPSPYDNAKKVFPAVVRVATTSKMGSGIIVSKEGLVLTSQHVVDNNTTATVQLNNGASYQGSVAVSDWDRDLAVIKLPANPSGYPFAAMGSSAESDALQISSPILIVGYPAGTDIEHVIVTTGILCAFPPMRSVNYLQSDAKIFPGSSGGPMTDKAGNVIGIINSQYSNLEGHCATFATAISEATALLDKAAHGQTAAVQPAPAVSKPANPATRTPCAEVGCQAPDFTLSTPDGKPVSLSSFKGKKVILAFVSTRCSTCLEISLCIQQFYSNWPREQMEIISIVSQEKPADVASWIKTYGFKNTVVLDPTGDVYNKYRAEKVPALYFLDAYGTIKIKKFGQIDDCAVELDSLLKLY